MSTSQTIVSYPFQFDSFENLNEVIARLRTSSFKKLEESAQADLVSFELLSCIHQKSEPCFLLPAVIRFIEELHLHAVLPEYTLNTFEFWLNQFSGLSKDENYRIRGKISGRYIPRSDYQIFFPIGMGKTFQGSHYVTGHGSPDLDTTVASFWGWLDSFSARVSEGLHIWNLPPGGILSTEDAGALTEVLGKSIFKSISQNRSSLTLSGLDFTCQKNLIKKSLKDSSLDSEHVRHQNACMVIDEEGFFLGDMRTADYEGIRQIQAIVTHCMIWFENVFHTKFIELFTQEKVRRDEVLDCAEELFNEPIKRCLDNRSVSPSFHTHFNTYLTKILGIENGTEASFKELARALKEFSQTSLIQFKLNIKETLTSSDIFDQLGNLVESRPKIFKTFNTIIHNLDEVLSDLQYFTETIGIALKIKKEVFGFSPRYVTPLSTLDELKDKMSVFHHLTVVYPNKSGRLWPLGIIRAEDIRQPILGTVSLRDFCNRNEVRIASYFEIISVIDHHKSEIESKTAPVFITGDTQSCNILIAEKNFEINDRYPLSGRSSEKQKATLETFDYKKASEKDLRLQQKRLRHHLTSLNPSPYYIHSDRAFLEYMTYLHAIIDDTDLFSKVTPRDLYCIAEILNRMKSILIQDEAEVLHLDDLKQDPKFIEKATRRIVEDIDMHSLYSKIFKEKEDRINESIWLAAHGKSADIFSDSKEQNGCCRIGQTKIFSTNAISLHENYERILNHWVEKAEEVYANNEQIDLHIHMISTIPNAEEVYKGLPKNYLHRDYIWIWIPNSKQAFDHLASFLNAFKGSDSVKNTNMRFQVLGRDNLSSYSNIFKHHFLAIPEDSQIKTQKKAPLAVLSFDAGTLNSRKAHITPYLPLLVK
jgi:hypothetical protein